MRMSSTTRTAPPPRHWAAAGVPELAAGWVLQSKRRWALGLAAGLASLGSMAMPGCELGGGHGTGQGPKGNQVLDTPILEIEPPDEVVPVTVGAEPGDETELTFRLINAGTSTLQVLGLAVVGELGPEGDPVFRLSAVNAGCTDPVGCEAWVWEPGAGPLAPLAIRSPSEAGAAAADFARVTVTYRRPEGVDTRSATLSIHTNAIDRGDRAIVLVAEPGVPVSQVTPDEVRFDPMGLGESATLPITLSNVGSDTLRIQGLDVFGSDDFRITLDGVTYAPGQQVTLAGPLLVTPGTSATLTVTYAPTSLDTAEAAVVIHTNDPVLPSGTEVGLRGSLEAPCLAASPPTVEFGLRPVGLQATRPLTLVSCGSAPVTITRLFVAPGGSASFSVAGVDRTPVDLPSPLVLPVNGESTLEVRYTPTAPAEVTLDGEVVGDGAILVAESDSLAGVLEVPLTGAGATPGCPLAVAQLEGDPIVLSGAVVQLRGDQSYAPGAPVVAWQWSVEQPAGSAVLFAPAATAPNPTVELDVVGTYRFGLVIWDEHGVKSCWTAFATVTVVPQKGLQAELVWDTPADPDPSDVGLGAGADLDLHVAHPLGFAFGADVTGDGLGDGWFSVPYDCFWGNPSPDWGSSHPLAKDDPVLERDDADGAGPEVITLSTPQGSALYRVGVHAYSDHGFGPSTATLRIYLDGALVFTDQATLVEGDLWDAAWIDWSERRVKGVTNADGQQVILPAYPTPAAFSP